MTVTDTSNQIPREATEAEAGELARALAAHTDCDDGDALAIARSAFVAVYDDYQTGGPSYRGKLMSVVWDGSPTTFDVYTLA